MTEKMKDKNGWLGSVFVLTAGVCWGFIGFFSNHLSEAGYNSVPMERFMDVYRYGNIQCRFL